MESNKDFIKKNIFSYIHVPYKYVCLESDTEIIIKSYWHLCVYFQQKLGLSEYKNRTSEFVISK